MSDPAGWRWIDAWLNRTIGDEDFASLQKLLRDDPGARRTFRRYMAMDTALRDRAEAQALFAVSEVGDAPNAVRLTLAIRPKFAWREVLAWSTAAACLLVAAIAWWTRPTTEQNSPLIVQTEPPTESRAVENRGPVAAELTIAEQRERLLASAPDVLHLQLVSDNGGANESGGDIVWSSGRQMGYLRLRGLAGQAAAQRQYQLWIVGSDVSGNELIHGGSFPVDRDTGELILPIQADHFVQQPKMFVVNVEPSGGGATLSAPLLARADGAGQ